MSRLQSKPPMARRYLMTWVPSRKGWLKHYRGGMYSVLCRQLEVEETKEASWQAANRWWESKKAEFDARPRPPDPQQEFTAATQFAELWDEFQQADKTTQRAIVGVVLGKERLEALEEQTLALLDGEENQDRTITEQIEAWSTALQAAVAAGSIDVSRFDAYLRNIAVFRDWIGGGLSIDLITAAKLDGFYNFLAKKVGERTYSPSYAHSIFGAAKQFILRLAELGVTALSGNIRSRKFRFGHSQPRKIPVFTTEEVTRLLAGCDGLSERTRLYLLLALNCGMYQSDISDLGEDEVDWGVGTLTHPRSKTPESQVVKYKLWPETSELLQKHRQQGQAVLNERESPRVLLTERGKPLVYYWMEEGKLRRYDPLQSAWSRPTARVKLLKPFKLLRKTSASLLADHRQYKFYVQYFLGHSPKTVADKHYVVPSDEEFFEALGWLRKQYGLGS